MNFCKVSGKMKWYSKGCLVSSNFTTEIIRTRSIKITFLYEHLIQPKVELIADFEVDELCVERKLFNDKLDFIVHPSGLELFL